MEAKNKSADGPTAGRKNCGRNTDASLRAAHAKRKHTRVPLIRCQERKTRFLHEGVENQSFPAVFVGRQFGELTVCLGTEEVQLTHPNPRSSAGRFSVLFISALLHCTQC
ncbi:hypothetical protein DPX16_12567 [Anabarilius grahami]|uniref:Uncharacterized protein n=1 Tax=Anabarilius grahami TaxID=495550 RepID=A0A3N0YKK1_ANAGA|nr:hypothetical protein DPX16_12567 [Anabarilius grahami]